MAGTGNPSYLGDQSRRMAWTRETEVAGSQEHVTALQPGGDRTRLCLTEKKKIQLLFMEFIYLHYPLGLVFNLRIFELAYYSTIVIPPN